MRNTWLPLLAVLGACAGGDDTSDDTDVVDTDVDAPTRSVVGTWRVVDDQGGLAGTGLVGIEHLVFRDDLSAEAYTRNDAAQRGCPDTAWGPVGDAALLLKPMGGESSEVFLLVDAPTADTLVFTDSTGATIRVEREAEVPEEARCRAATTTDAVEIEGAMDYWSNLVFDGTHLRVATGDGTYAVDTTTGALSDPWTFGWDQYQLPMTIEDGIPWLGCGCGHLDVLRHVQPGGTLLDELATSDVGGELSIRAAAHDGTALWALGTSPDGKGHLRSFNTDLEPDTLLGDLPTALVARGLAFHQGTLYGVTDHGLVRVDTATGKATATWEIRGDTALRWHGIASDGTRLWILSEGEEHDTLAAVTLE